MDFGFVGDAYTAPSIYQDAQELVNWMCELDPRKPMEGAYIAQGVEQSRGIIALYPTPGYTQVLSFTDAAEVRQLYVVSGGTIMIAVCGSSVYSVNTSLSASKIGSLVTSSGPVSVSDNGIEVYLVDGSNRYSYTLATAYFTQIPSTDGAFTGGSKVICVDNFFVYNRPQTQQFAASTALSTSTPALSFGSKFGNADNLVTLESVSREVALIGERETEWWTDTGSFPFPFSIIPGTATQHGCAAQYSVARLGEGIAMLSQDTRGQGIVLMSVGYSWRRISTHAVENSLVGKTINDARAYTYQIEGHEIYVLTFPTLDTTWCYDLSTDKWHKWLSVDSYNVFHRHRSNCFANFAGLPLIGDYANGKVYQLSPTVYTENGTTIRRLRRCPHIVSDFRRQFLSELQIQFHPGVGLQSGQGQSPQAMLRWSDDGGSTWSNEHWRTIGAVGKYKNRAIWRRLGYARDRVFEVAVTDPVNCAVISANLVAEAGE